MPERDGVDAIIEQWRREYNDVRPHSSLGYETPARFAAACAASSGTSGADARRPFHLQPTQEDQDPEPVRLS